MKSQQYLQLKHRTWWFQRAIPMKLRPYFDGKANYMENLRTSDLKAAHRKRADLVAKTDAVFKKATEADKDELLADALALNEERRKWEADPLAWSERIFGRELEDKEVSPVDPIDFIREAAERILRDRGKCDAERFVSAAMGHVGVDEHIEEHLAAAGIVQRSQLERRRIVETLAEWRPGMSMDKLDQTQAGDFVREVLEGQHYTTANKKLSHLKGYWRWLTERGIAKSNPWNGQRVRAPRQLASDEEEKAFTDAQVVTLLTSLIAGSNGARLRDVMMIAALSGMRIEEICQLSVKDCQEGVFNIRQSKTRAGRRRVPMHSRLVDLIERRMSEKAGDDFLIHEITGRNLSRSDSLIKQFIRHRRRYGVDEKVPGHRRSLVNFHSWRRWFVSRAIQAGIPVLVVESVIGHKSQNLAVGVYSEGASEQQMRECVEAVVLPDGIPAKSL